ncbi:hypothetical protein [Gloeocapsa sp. PCC 73106]|uniref:hypothetical protein n=1 Tax=Gloeocapsa sp. PCC 73106 TaxID=102232 RepID=UPI0002ABB127|nr:hypothetical protein [Gloeocapsa sp. PCC 73106]ELR97488.1 hypothetical protein GLO73106DRAFT_00012980 [Gloeocapsa sp. PCC 73106]
MSLIAKLVLLAWLPIAIWIFRRYPPRTAILITAIAGVLFLPQRVEFRVPLLPDYNSQTAVVYAILIGLLIYDTKWLTRLEPWWLDLPILIWCISPFFASWRNDLGIYDGINESISGVWQYGIPYLVGRVYFRSLEDLKQLAVAIIKGALIYVPFCWWEGLMSPNIHRFIYGYFPHTGGFAQTLRYGGYRPNVFMSHGLAVGLWMMTATLIAVWLWQSKKAVLEIWGLDMVYIVPILVFTLVWCRSTGAVFYFAYGLFILAIAKWTKSSWPLLLLIAAIVVYLYLNVQGIFDKTPVLEVLSNIFSPQRIQSLEFRLDEETLLSAKAREKFWFGWGGWGRNRIFEEDFYGIFRDTSITDSLWILGFGTKGVIATICLTATMLVPPVIFNFFRYPVTTWFHPRIAAAAAFVALLPLLMLDNLLNNHLTMVCWVITGGLTGLILNPQEKLSKILWENKLDSGSLPEIPGKIAQR